MTRTLFVLVLLSACGGSPTPSDGSADPADAASTGDDHGPSVDGSADSLAGLPSNTWTWLDIPGAKCRDGSQTGIGINPNPASTKLLIFMQGGGACFNAGTCVANASSYGAADFASSAETSAGILDRTDTQNQVRDYSMVYIPYCTGDIHAGNNPDGTVAGVVGTQQFVGYVNMAQDLAHLVQTFAGVDEVLLTGSSAGGFGAMANFIQAQKAFGSVPVHVIDDSGPFMGSPYVAPCLASLWASTWRLDLTVQADCGADCASDTNLLLEYQTHVGKAYPGHRFGLIDSVGDIVIRDYFGYGGNDCTVDVPLSAADYEAGLDQIRTSMSAYDFGAFLFSGDDHTSLLVGYDTRATAGVQLTDWVGALATGTVTNLGP